MKKKRTTNVNLGLSKNNHNKSYQESRVLLSFHAMWLTKYFESSIMYCASSLSPCPSVIPSLVTDWNMDIEFSDILWKSCFIERLIRCGFDKCLQIVLLCCFKVWSRPECQLVAEAAIQTLLSEVKKKKTLTIRFHGAKIFWPPQRRLTLLNYFHQNLLKCCQFPHNEEVY